MTGNAETDALNQVLQADLAKIGLNVTIKSMDLPAWVDTVNNVKYFGIWVGGIAYTQFEPSTALLSSRGLAPTANSSGFVSDSYTRLVNASAAEPDASRRKMLYQQINDLLLDESFLIILAKTPSRMLTTAAVHGLQPTLHGTFSPTEAWIAR
jgi:peptide/nickel transport system substrate-binding protein